MTEPQTIDALRPNHSTGPNVVSNSSTKTPEGKKLAPVGAYENDWRLKRARTIESGLFAMGMQTATTTPAPPGRASQGCHARR